MKYSGSLRIALAFTGTLLCSCQKPSPQEHEPSTPITVTKVDGGPLTVYDYSAKGRTKAVTGTTLRRSFVILNDPNCPLEITSFGLRTEDPGRTMEDATSARLAYVLHWHLRSRASITAWEVQNLVFDTLNRFVTGIVDTNEARTGDTKQLGAGEDYETDREGWWKSPQTDQLGRWLTSVVFVTAIRTEDGKVWSSNKQSLVAKMKQLSFELPADRQW
jgi:hypothetical protein